MTNMTLNEYESRDGALSQGTIRGPSKSRQNAPKGSVTQYQEQQPQSMSNEDLAQTTIEDPRVQARQNNLASESMSDHEQDEMDQLGTHRKSVGSQQDLLTRNQYAEFDNRNEVTLSQE